MAEQRHTRLARPVPKDLETGDLLIFRTRNAVSKLNRCFTAALWDHVALVMRTASGLKTVESVGELGIACWDLQTRLNDDTVAEVAARKLYCKLGGRSPPQSASKRTVQLGKAKETKRMRRSPLTNEAVDALNGFLQAVRDRPYRFVPGLKHLLSCCPTRGLRRHSSAYEIPWAVRAREKSRKRRLSEQKQTQAAAVKKAGVATQQFATQRHQLEKHAREEAERALERVKERMRQQQLPEMNDQEKKTGYAPHDEATASRDNSKDDLSRAREDKDGEPWMYLTEQRSFFCSSFVASCYMAMGILTDDPPPRAYMPQDFAEAGRSSSCVQSVEPRFRVCGNAACMGGTCRCDAVNPVDTLQAPHRMARTKVHRRRRRDNVRCSCIRARRDTPLSYAGSIELGDLMYIRAPRPPNRRARCGKASRTNDTKTKQRGSTGNAPCTLSVTVSTPSVPRRGGAAAAVSPPAGASDGTEAAGMNMMSTEVALHLFADMRVSVTGDASPQPPRRLPQGTVADSPSDADVDGDGERIVEYWV